MKSKYLKGTIEAQKRRGIRFLKWLRELLEIKRLVVLLVRHIVLITIITILIYMLVVLSTTVFGFNGLDKSIFDGDGIVKFEIFRRCSVLFVAGNSSRVEIDRTHTISKSGEDLNFYIGKGYLPYLSCNIIITKPIASRKRYEFMCYKSCEFDNHESTWGSALELSIFGNSTRVILNNITLPNMIMNSEKGAFTLRNSSLTNSLLSLRNFEIRILNDFDTDYIIHQISSTIYFFTDAQTNVGSTLEVNFCDLYTNCTHYHGLLEIDENVLSSASQEKMFDEYFADAHNSNLFESPDNHYINIHYRDKGISSPDKNYILLEKSNIMLVPEVIYNIKTLESLKVFQKFIFYNHFMFPFQVVSINLKKWAFYPISDKSIYTDSTSVQNQVFLQYIYDLSYNFFKNSYQKNILFLKFMPLNIQVILIRAETTSIIDSDIEFMKQSLTGVYENFEINLPIIHSSYTVMNEFVNLLFFVNKTKEIFNIDGYPNNYEALIQINRPDIFSNAKKYIHMTEGRIKTDDEMMAGYFQIRWNNDQHPQLWPLIDKHNRFLDRQYFMLGILLTSFVLGLLITVHVRFLQNSITFYNQRKSAYSKHSNTEYKIEKLPENVVLRWLTLMFLLDYNQVANYYYNAVLARFENSITVFYKLSFKKVTNSSERKPLKQAELIKFKDFIKRYKSFCFFNDLSIQNIENFISEAKLKDFNHKITMKESEDLYINDLQVIPGTKLSTAQSDLSNYGDSLDLFISQKCSFFANKSTKLEKLVDKYKAFCTDNELFAVDFSEDYLRFRYQLQIFKKQIAYIEPGEISFMSKKVFRLRTKYFMKKSFNDKSQKRILNRFDHFVSFTHEMKKLLFFLVFDIMCFQNLLVFIMIMQMLNNAILDLMYHIYTLCLPEILNKMPTMAFFFFMMFFIFLLRLFKKNSFLHSPLKVTKPFEVVIFSFIWFYIYFQKFTQFYFMFYYLLRAWKVWVIFNYEMNFKDLNMFLLLVVNILWAIYAILYNIKYKRVKELTARIHRGQVMNAFKINFPITNLQKVQSVSSSNNSKSVHKLISHLQVVKTVLQNKENLDSSQFESIMTDFFQQIDVAKNDDIVKLVLILNKNNVKLKELTEIMIQFGINQTIFSVFNNQDNIMNYRDQVEIIQSLVNELVYMKLMAKYSLSGNLLRMFDKLFKTRLFTSKNREVQKLFDVFLVKKTVHELDDYKIENIIEFKDLEQNILEMMRPLINPLISKSSTSSTNDYLTHQSTLLNKDLFLKKVFLQDSNATFNKIFNLKIMGMQNNSFDLAFSKEDKYLATIEKYINPDKKYDKTNIKVDTINLVYSLQNLKANLFQEHFQNLFRKRDVIDPESDLKNCMFLLKSLKHTNLLLFIQYDEALFSSNPTIKFFCTSFSMNFRELVGMMFMFNGVHTDYNYHFIGVLCRNHGYRKMNSFCNFVYSLLNYKDPTNTYWLKTYLPSEFIELFLYLKEEISSIGPETVDLIISRLEGNDPAKNRLLKLYITSRDLEMLNRFKIDNTTPGTSANFYFNIFDMLIDIIGLKNDKMFVYEKILKCFSKYINDKKFLVFFKELYSYINDISLTPVETEKVRADLNKKYTFIFPRNMNKMFAYFEFLLNLSNFNEAKFMKKVLPQIYGSNCYSSKLIKNMKGVILSAKHEMSTMCKVLSAIKSLKGALKNDIIVRNGKLLGACIENLITQRVKYSFEEATDIVDTAFATFFKFESLDAFKNNKFNEFLVCLYKSMLMGNALYLCNFFAKFHTQCRTMLVLIQQYFNSPDIDAREIYDRFMNSVQEFTPKQLAIVEMYFMLNYKYSMFSENVDLLHKAFDFDTGYSDLLEIYTLQKYSWKRILENMASNLLKSTRAQESKNLRFINSPLVNAIFSVLKPAELNVNDQAQMSELQVKISRLRELKKDFCKAPFCNSMNRIQKILAPETFNDLLASLEVHKCELALLIGLTLHQFEENEMIILFNKMNIEFPDQKLLANLVIIKKDLSFTKLNSTWNRSLINSSFFHEIKYNPIVSWLIVYAIKRDYYAVVRLLRSRIQIFQGSKHLRGSTMRMLYTVVHENDIESNAEKEIFAHCKSLPYKKLVNCKLYYHWKLYRSDKQSLDWMQLKLNISKNVEHIHETDKHFHTLITYMLFVYNLEKFRVDGDSRFNADLVRLMLRKSICRILKGRYSGQTNLDQVRVKKSLKYEKKSLRSYFEQVVSKRVDFDIGNEEFVRFSEKEFRLPLSRMNQSVIYDSFNQSIIGLYTRIVQKDENSRALGQHLDRCLSNKVLCCWSHSLTSLSDSCIKKLFLTEENYIRFGTHYLNLLTKLLEKASRLKVTEEGLEEVEAVNETPEKPAAEYFIMHLCMQSLVRKLTWMMNHKEASKKKISSAEFGKLNKLLVLIIDAQNYYSDNRILINLEKNLLSKIIEFIFVRMTLNTTILTDTEKKLSKIINTNQKSEARAGFDGFSHWLQYFKTFLILENEPSDDLPYAQVAKKDEAKTLYNVLEDEFVESKYSKVAAKHFIDQCSFSPDRVKFLRGLCDYQRSYVKVVFDDFPLASKAFPQKHFDEILLILNFKDTITNMEKAFLKSLLKSHFKSNPKNLIDLVQFLTLEYKKFMFKGYLGSTDDVSVLCSMIFNRKTYRDEWTRYCMAQHEMSDDLADKIWLLASGIEEMQNADTFSRLSSVFHNGKHPEQANLYIKCIYDLLPKPNVAMGSSPSKVSALNIFSTVYIEKEAFEEVQSFIKIVEAVMEGNFQFFQRPQESYLKVFFENLSFDNVEIIRIFALMDAIRNREVSMEETESILYQFISFSQYDLTIINLTETKNLLIILKSLLTGNHLQLIDLFKSPAFKKQYSFYLSFYVYMQKMNLLPIFNERSDWEKLYSHSRDYVFLQLLKTNFAKNNRILEDDHNLAALVNDQQFLQDFLYNFDDKKLAIPKSIHRVVHSKRLIKIDSFNAFKLNSILNASSYSNEIHRLYHFFIDSELFYTEFNNFNESQRLKLLSLNTLMNNKDDYSSKNSPEVKKCLQVLFDQNLPKSETILKYLIDEHKLFSAFNPLSSKISFRLQHSFLRHVKVFSQVANSSDHTKPVKAFEKLLLILYENDINLQVTQIINLFCKIGVFSHDSKTALVNNFTKLNLNTIFEFTKRLLDFNFDTSLGKSTLIYYLSILFDDLNLSKLDQIYFFYMHSVLSKEENLIRHWFSNKNVSVKIFEELKANYQKLINTKKPSLNAIGFVRKEEEIKELNSLRLSLGKNLETDQRLYNIYIFKIIECVNQKGSQSVEVIEYILGLLHNFRESDKFYVKIFFQLNSPTSSAKKLAISKDEFGILNSKIVSYLVEQQFIVNGKYSVFRNVNIVVSTIFFIFANMFFITSRFGRTITDISINVVLEELIPRLFISKLNSHHIVLLDLTGHIHTNRETGLSKKYETIFVGKGHINTTFQVKNRF